jgi:hypothetical protein
LVDGRNLSPQPAAGMTAVRTSIVVSAFYIKPIAAGKLTQA